MKKIFDSQTEVHTYARKAAKFSRGTILNRPANAKVSPIDGSIFLALKHNIPNFDFHGKILKIVEKNNDPGSLYFDHEELIIGGDKAGFTSPRELIFDKLGNLWVTSDIPGKFIGALFLPNLWK